MARRDTGLTQSEFIEIIGYPSETDFKQIERGTKECPASFIAVVSEATGISQSWIKHGKGSPYAARSDAFDLRDIEADMALIADLAPQRIYVCLDRWFYNVALVVNSAPHRWIVFDGLFQIDVHRWINSHREIAGVYAFLHHLFEQFDRPDMGIRVESRVLPWLAYRQLLSGSVCPKRVLAKYPIRVFDGERDHWADDIRDIYHRFFISRTYKARYGSWFIQAQECFRAYVSEDEAIRPWDWDEDAADRSI